MFALLTPGAVAGADSREALQRAALLVQQGRLVEADQQVQPALSDPATRAAACSVLGTIRFQQKRLDESARLLREAIRLEPRLVGAHLSLAQVYVLQRKPDLALGLYQQAIELDPSSAPARLAAAAIEADRKNYRRSLGLLEPALETVKRSPEGLLLLAVNYLSTGNRRAAAALAADWMRLSGVPQSSSIEFALRLLKGKIVPEAIEVLEHTRRTGPMSYDLELNLGGAYLLNGDAVRALDAYDLALTFKPDSLPVLQQAAVTAEGHGELERSLSYWMRARKIAPDDPQILLGFGRVCLEMDLLDDAEPALEKAARLEPGNVGYQYMVAAAKVGKRQFEAAQAIIDPLVRKQPGDARLQYALGSILYIRGHLNEAAGHLRESARLQPDQLAAHYYLALVARDLGNDAEAIAILERLLARHPDHAASCEVLGSLLMSAQRYDEAEQNLRKAVRLNPKSVKANYQLGLLLARMGNKPEADRQLELARSLRQEDEASSRLQLRLLESQP